MEVMYFKKCILDKKLPSLSILTGDDALMSIYLEQLYNNFDIKKLNSINDYLCIYSSKFNFNKNQIYIIFNDETFEKDNKLWTNKLTNVIFVYDKLLKTSKFFKAFEPNIVYFDKINDTLLKGLIKNRVSIADENVDWIIKECNHNYFKCLNEVEKIAIFPKDQHQNLFYEFVKDELLCKKDNVEDFSFSNAISNRDKVSALELSSKIKTPSDVLGQLSLVYNNLRKQLLVQGGSSSAEQVGLDPKVYFILSKKKKYTVSELCKAMDFLIDCFNKIKLGLMDYQDALNLFIIKYI